MHLPAFIAKAISFFDSAESKLDALSKSQSEITDLRAQVSALSEKASGFEAERNALAKEVDDLNDFAKTTSEAHANEIAGLNAKLTAESRKANDVIAGQGIPAENIPPLAPDNAGASKNLTLTEQCLAAKKKTLKK